MTNEERDLISRFIARVGGQPQATGGFLSGSVPATAPALPPIDREADAFIGQQMQQYPEAKYRLTQTAIVQEAALGEAQNTIQRLQWELEQARQAVQQQAQRAPESKGFFGGLFGGGAQPQRPQGPPPGQQGPWGGQPGQRPGYAQGGPPPQQAPQYQPGTFQRSGSGFLGSALTTAAGVAGGMVVGNALMNAFGGHGGASSWGSSASAGAGAAGGSMFDNAGYTPGDPTSGYVTDANYSDPFAGGGTEKDFGGGYDTNAGWDGAGQDAGGFDSGGGSVDSGGGGFDDNT